MPNVYKSGELIQEFQGSVKGGVTVVVHDWKEIDGLRALCMLAGKPPENPLHAVYRALLVNPLDLEAWEMWRKRRAVVLPQWMPTTEQTDVSIEESIDVTVEMDLGLFAARETWSHQGEEAKELCAALSVPDPETNPEGQIEYEGENPGLVFYKGSISAALMQGALKVGGFGIALWSGRGLAASRRAELIVEDMRSKAEKIQVHEFEKLQRELAGNIPFRKVAKLERIDKMDWGLFKGKHAVILFLHGLLSTDVGVFDSLIQKLNKDPMIQSRVALIGWPHDSLASIETNARTLQRYIQRAVGLDGPNVAFICHSRGGLLARRVVMQQLNAGLREFNVNWPKGCDSGPHELYNGESPAIKAWLIERAKMNPLGDCDTLFISERRKPLSRCTVWLMITQVAEAAGLEYLSIHPHMLRHSCGYALVNKGTDIRIIQGYLGHRSISSTVRYTKLDSKRFAKLF